jgi:hypothetical protein
MNGISALIRRDVRELSHFFSCHARIQRENNHLQIKNGLSPDTDLLVP